MCPVRTVTGVSSRASQSIGHDFHLSLSQALVSKRALPKLAKVRVASLPRGLDTDISETGAVWFGAQVSLLFLILAGLSRGPAIRSRRGSLSRPFSMY
jgi:hypothetical protein